MILMQPFAPNGGGESKSSPQSATTVKGFSPGRGFRCRDIESEYFQIKIHLDFFGERSAKFV